MFFITWALIFSFVSFVVGETARVRDLFINYALIAYICALASAHLDKTNYQRYNRRKHHCFKKITK